ncbi:DNA-binding PadR family transcriptional regulator [Nakamurella sp. UYEF19]|uniref:PadR family transcriptional regulator n=1 Tax=Nakamurella sp. UYEF19 TaxID=1756392 RepID=UPI00339B1C86
MTLSTQAVLRALLDDPKRDRYGLEICAATGLPSGTMHPILARLENLKWVESDWEKIDPQKEGRPRRRYYHLTTDGLASARIALAEAHDERTRIAARYRPVGRTPLGEPT